MKLDEKIIFDNAHRKKYPLLAGGDEAGRGPWAGPVSAAIVILPGDIFHPGIDDSKKLSEKEREALSAWVKKNALSYGIGRAEPEEIETINILEATKLAFYRAWENMKVKPDKIIFDAIRVSQIPIVQEGFIKGDSKSFLIGAASILAKVERDLWMKEYDKLYPEYGFSRHKGYGTKIHQQALEKYGVCPIHRKSFKPIATLLQKAL